MAKEGDANEGLESGGTGGVFPPIRHVILNIPTGVCLALLDGAVIFLPKFIVYSCLSPF